MARVSIDPSFIDRLQAIVGNESPAKITANALTLFSWAAEEAKKGRMIFSADAEGKQIERLAMPALANLKPE